MKKKGIGEKLFRHDASRLKTWCLCYGIGSDKSYIFDIVLVNVFCIGNSSIPDTRQGSLREKRKSIANPLETIFNTRIVYLLYCCISFFGVYFARLTYIENTVLYAFDFNVIYFPKLKDWKEAIKCYATMRMETWWK